MQQMIRLVLVLATSLCALAQEVLPRTAVRRHGQTVVLAFGKPSIVKPESGHGDDLSDHYGVTTELRLITLDRGPVQVAQLKIFSYNVAQLPVRYEGRRDRAANLNDIARHLNEAQYDIVCLQEAWSAIWILFPPFSPIAVPIRLGPDWEAFLDTVRENYPFHQRGPRADGEKTDSGLLILSRFPIIPPHHFSEFRQHADEIPETLAAKGILHARIQVGSVADDTIDVFTTHTDSISRDVRADQLAQVASFVQEHSRDALWVLTGDMNVDGASQSGREYQQMMTTLSGPLDLWTAFRQDEPAGYTEDHLQGTFRNFDNDHRNRLDYFLVPANTPGLWTHTGSSCTPDESSAARFESAAARFRHIGTATGAVVAKCNVTNPTDNGGNPFWNFLEVVYFDPPGTNQVTAELVRVSNQTGGVWTVASFDSNAPGLTANAAAQTNGVFFNHVFDFDTHAYYVHMTVRRVVATAANNPAVSIVRLKQRVE